MKFGLTNQFCDHILTSQTLQSLFGDGVVFGVNISIFYYLMKLELNVEMNCELNFFVGIWNFINIVSLCFPPRMVY
jgi:hypothetical protein